MIFPTFCTEPSAHIKLSLGSNSFVVLSLVPGEAPCIARTALLDEAGEHTLSVLLLFFIRPFSAATVVVLLEFSLVPLVLQGLVYHLNQSPARQRCTRVAIVSEIAFVVRAPCFGEVWPFGIEENARRLGHPLWTRRSRITG